MAGVAFVLWSFCPGGLMSGEAMDGVPFVLWSFCPGGFSPGGLISAYHNKYGLDLSNR